MGDFRWEAACKTVAAGAMRKVRTSGAVKMRESELDIISTLIPRRSARGLISAANSAQPLRRGVINSTQRPCDIACSRVELERWEMSYRATNS
jgi:hypothetical protein